MANKADRFYFKNFIEAADCACKGANYLVECLTNYQPEKIREMLEEMGGVSGVTIPDIKPILIHCGMEGSQRDDLREEEKIITTPCQALADMGNELELKNTWFVPWNRFLESIGSELPGILPKDSPIPPGFFEELEGKVDSVTGEEEIRQYFEDYVPGKAKLVEMLYCKDGCHNGDGIRGADHE